MADRTIQTPLGNLTEEQFQAAINSGQLAAGPGGSAQSTAWQTGVYANPYTSGPPAPAGGGAPSTPSAPSAPSAPATPGYSAPGTTAPGPSGPVDPSKLAQQIGYSPANPEAAFRNALRDSGIPSGALMRRGPIQSFFNSFAPGAYYQFLADAGRNNYTLSSDSFKNYLLSQIQSGFNMGNTNQNLEYIKQLAGRLPADGNFQAGAFGNAAEATLAGLLATSPYDTMAQLLLGQYSGALPPALVSQYLSPLVSGMTEQYSDQGQELKGKGLFDILSPFFFGAK